MSKQQCKCGKGSVSAYDGKCGHCRTKEEQKEHERKLVAVPVTDEGK